MADAEKKEKKHHHKSGKEGSKVDKKGVSKDKRESGKSSSGLDVKDKKKSSHSSSTKSLPDVPAANGSSPPAPPVPLPDSSAPITVVAREAPAAPAPATAAATPPVDPALAANAKFDLCAGCGKNIMGDISHALNRKWHLYCFTCAACNAPVSDEYYESDGRPYCRKDFNKQFGAICAGCKKGLQGKKLKALDKEWHPQCFVCGKCKKPFPEMEYYDIDSNPYCGPCYDQEEEKLSKP